MKKDRVTEIVDDLNQCIAMYSHSDSDLDREYLARIFYYAGVLAGLAQGKTRE